MSEAAQTEMLTRRICVALPRYAYRFSNEVQLHEGLAEALTQEKIEYAREHITGDDRFDFLCEGHVVIEAKVGGSMSAALRQAERYCKQGVVKAVIVVTARTWRMSDDERSVSFHGKPVHFVQVRGQSF